MSLLSQGKGKNMHPGNIPCVHQFDIDYGILQLTSQNSKSFYSSLSTWTSVSMQVVYMIPKR
jgi:hypothetical protein